MQNYKFRASQLVEVPSLVLCSRVSIIVPFLIGFFLITLKLFQRPTPVRVLFVCACFFLENCKNVEAGFSIQIPTFNPVCGHALFLFHYSALSILGRLRVVYVMVFLSTNSLRPPSLTGLTPLPHLAAPSPAATLSPRPRSPPTATRHPHPRLAPPPNHMAGLFLRTIVRQGRAVLSDAITEFAPHQPLAACLPPSLGPHAARGWSGKRRGPGWHMCRGMSVFCPCLRCLPQCVYLFGCFLFWLLRNLSLSVNGNLLWHNGGNVFGRIGRCLIGWLSACMHLFRGHYLHVICWV